MSNFEQPKYPACLTARYWDQNKSAIAKIAGETGVGTALKKLEIQYKSAFEMIDLMERRPSVNNFKLAAWDKTRDDALKVTVNEVGDLRQTAYNASKRLSETSAKFAKNKSLYKDMIKLCDEMEKAADKLAAECDPGKAKQWVLACYQQGRDWLDTIVELVTDGSMRKNCQVVQDLLEDMKQPSDWAKAGIKTKTRKVTQILGNAVKVTAAGYPLGVNAKTCKQLFDDLTLYADKTEQPFKDSDVKGFNEHRQTLNKLLAEVKKIG